MPSPTSNNLNSGSTLRVALAGLAHVHAAGYLDRLRNFPGVSLAGISDTRPDQVAAVSEAYRIPGYSSWSELFEEQRPDAVIVANENALHLKPASEAIRRGIAVLCEKPLGTDEEEMLRFLDLIDKHGGRCMTLLPNRFAVPVLEAKAALDAGLLGNLRAVYATNCGKMPGGFFVRPDLSGGGSMMDHTIHVADLTNWMVGAEPEEVLGIARTKLHPDIEVDDVSHVHYRYANGVVVTLDSSWSRHERYPSDRNLTMMLVGDKRSFFVDLTRDRMDVYGEQPGWIVGGDKVQLMLEAAMDCLKNDRPFPVTARDGYLASRVALRAYRNRWGD
ncbi:MAG: Gfo/Idh/MocA family oxidoreductase [Synergistaceae bacterium]|nr:Gfo/Idh/MocA family oxidoreductase [Synergistaceae bacterium]